MGQISTQNRALLGAPAVKEKMFNQLGKKAEKVLASLVSATNTNPKLLECDFGTLMGAAYTAASLDLPINNSLGYTYIIPYGNSAQFQLGYKGIYQLMIRSGVLKKLITTNIKEGELIKYDRLEDTYEFEIVDDEKKREKLKTIGYYCKLILNNGFEKELYWSYEKMEAHAKKYSKSFNSRHSFWQQNFDEMAFKTLVKQISKYAPLSIDMQQAIEKDQSIVKEDGTFTYDDNSKTPDTTDYATQIAKEQQEQQEDLPFD